MSALPGPYVLEQLLMLILCSQLPCRCWPWCGRPAPACAPRCCCLPTMPSCWPAGGQTASAAWPARLGLQVSWAGGAAHLYGELAPPNCGPQCWADHNWCTGWCTPGQNYLVQTRRCSPPSSCRRPAGARPPRRAAAPAAGRRRSPWAGAGPARDPCHPINRRCAAAGAQQPGIRVPGFGGRCGWEATRACWRFIVEPAAMSRTALCSLLLALFS